MTTAAQRATAIDQARAAIVRATKELDTARSLAIAHLRNAADGPILDELDDAIKAAFDVRRSLGRLR